MSPQYFYLECLTRYLAEGMAIAPARARAAAMTGAYALEGPPNDGDEFEGVWPINRDEDRS